MRRDFYALDERKKIFLNYFSNKFVFFKKIFSSFKRKFFFQTTGKKKFFLIFFFKNIFFSNKSFFQKKNGFQTSFILITVLISSKLFIRHLSRRIFRIESAGKGAIIQKSRAVIGGKRINERTSFVYILYYVHNSFCRQRAGLEVLIKVTYEADRWKESGKSFTKIDFLM